MLNNIKRLVIIKYVVIGCGIVVAAIGGYFGISYLYIKGKEWIAKNKVLKPLDNPLKLDFFGKAMPLPDNSKALPLKEITTKDVQYAKYITPFANPKNDKKLLENFKPKTTYDDLQKYLKPSKTKKQVENIFKPKKKSNSKKNIFGW